MKKIAVFGKPGSGKSTLSRQLSAATGIPLHPLDSIAYQANGERVERARYDEAHAAILASDAWIIDGLGPIDSFNQRLAAADTLIYIDLPYWLSYWFVTKRLIKGVAVTPEGWPEGSSVLKGSLQSYQVLKKCPAFWNAAFMEKLEEIAHDKTLEVIRSKRELAHFVANSTHT